MFVDFATAALVFTLYRANRRRITVLYVSKLALQKIYHFVFKCSRIRVFDENFKTRQVCKRQNDFFLISHT